MSLGGRIFFNSTLLTLIPQGSVAESRIALRLIELIDEALEIGRIKKEIMEKVNQETAENQRKYVLREQMSIIKKELGEDSVDANVKEL